MSKTAARILADLRARTIERGAGTFACIPLIEADQQLMRLVTAWPKVRPNPVREGEVCPEVIAPYMEVRWLWTCIDPDPLPRWIQVAGLPLARHTINACYVLIDNEAVMPDGTLALVVEQYIQRKVGAFLDSMLPRRARAVPPPPPPPPEQASVPA